MFSVAAQYERRKRGAPSRPRTRLRRRRRPPSSFCCWSEHGWKAHEEGEPGSSKSQNGDVLAFKGMESGPRRCRRRSRRPCASSARPGKQKTSVPVQLTKSGRNPATNLLLLGLGLSRSAESVSVPDPRFRGRGLTSSSVLSAASSSSESLPFLAFFLAGAFLAAAFLGFQGKIQGSVSAAHAPICQEGKHTFSPSSSFFAAFFLGAAFFFVAPPCKA